MLNDYLLLTPSQLRTIKDDPESTMLQILIVSIMTHAANKGDPMRFTFLLDRLVGKVKERVEMEVNPYMQMPLRELEALVRAKLLDGKS